MHLDRIAILLKKANLMCDKLADPILRPHDLTLTQYKTLKFLLTQPPHTVHQVDIERRFSITNPTVTGILHGLERKGLIERLADPEDGRSKVICLTERARAMEGLLYQLGERVEAEMTRDLDAGEREELMRLLKKVLAREGPQVDQ